MFNTILEATFEPGSRLLYRSKDGKRVFIIGEVVDCQPPRRLVHTFRFTAMDEEPTLVAWDLSETADGVRVTVEHTHFSNQAATHESVLELADDPVQLQVACLERGEFRLGPGSNTPSCRLRVHDAQRDPSEAATKLPRRLPAAIDSPRVAALR